jgi:N-acetylglucosamine-6-sulfatase
MTVTPRRGTSILGRRTLGALVLFVTVALAGSTTAVVTERPAAAASSRPNIILITADDMRLDDLQWMPRTKALVQGSGVTATTFLSNHPICCPARAEILTGQYGHNSGVLHNDGEFGGYPALRKPNQHIGRWLEDAGYRTALVGKFLNRWEQRPRTPAGWTVFNPIVRGIYAPFDIRMWRHGRPRTFTGVHTSDLVGRFTTRYIRRFAESRAPFFIWMSQVAPHDMRVNGKIGPPVPARRHRSLYQDVRPPSLSDPAFNEADVSDKPVSVRRKGLKSRRKITRLHRARIRSLRSVDDQVEAVVNTLRKVGELERTYIFFLSDNGYLLGEHRLIGKNRPYEQALRVPLVVRGPSLPAGAETTATYGMVDLAATFLEIAQTSHPRPRDGRSMLPALRGGGEGYADYLIQAGESRRRWFWRGVRSSDHTYAKYGSGAEELYDLIADPHQLDNLAKDPAYAEVLASQRARLRDLRGCEGAVCWSPSSTG